MADKGKGKDKGSEKKAKTVKAGNRPHELREREAAYTKGPAKTFAPAESR